MKGTFGLPFTKVFPKDEVKAMLRQKNKIDGLRLTSDNRLIQTDNKIALYVQSCEELGIIPLTIIKKDGRYILTGIRSYQLPNIQC